MELEGDVCVVVEQHDLTMKRLLVHYAVDAYTHPNVKVIYTEYGPCYDVLLVGVVSSTRTGLIIAPWLRSLPAWTRPHRFEVDQYSVDAQWSMKLIL